jgi:hypothetical protein
VVRKLKLSTETVRGMTIRPLGRDAGMASNSSEHCEQVRGPSCSEVRGACHTSCDGRIGR